MNNPCEGCICLPVCINKYNSHTYSDIDYIPTGRLVCLCRDCKLICNSIYTKSGYYVEEDGYETFYYLQDWWKRHEK